MCSSYNIIKFDILLYCLYYGACKFVGSLFHSILSIKIRRRLSVVIAETKKKFFLYPPIIINNILIFEKYFVIYERHIWSKFTPCNSLNLILFHVSIRHFVCHSWTVNMGSWCCRFHWSKINFADVNCERVDRITTKDVRIFETSCRNGIPSIRFFFKKNNFCNHKRITKSKQKAKNLQVNQRVE